MITFQALTYAKLKLFLRHLNQKQTVRPSAVSVRALAVPAHHLLEQVEVPAGKAFHRRDLQAGNVPHHLVAKLEAQSAIFTASKV